MFGVQKTTTTVAPLTATPIIAAATTAAGFGSFTPLSSTSVPTTKGFNFGTLASTAATGFGASTLTSTTNASTGFALPSTAATGFGTMGNTKGFKAPPTTTTTFNLKMFSTPTTATAITGTSGTTTGFNVGTFATSGTGFNLGAATATTTTTSGGFGLGITSTTSSTGFNLAATATTTSSTGFTLGTPATSATTGFTLGVPATSATTGFTLGMPATSAPTGFTLGNPATSATTGFSLGATPSFSSPAAPTSAASSSSLSLSTPATTTTTTVATTSLTVTSSPTVQNTAPQVKFSQLEENINKWTIELEEQEKVFMNQVAHINEWDRLLLSNGDKIVSLNNSVEKLKLEQQQLDHELDFIVAQQRELEECLQPLEKEFTDITVSDPERDATYRLAENLNTQLRHMSEDLKEIIEDINEKNKNQDTTDPIVQIGRILNAHMNSLQWVDQNTTLIKQQLDQVTKLTEIHRRENDSTQNL